MPKISRKPLKTMSPARRRMYRRRRIAVSIVLLLLLALTIFCAISIVKGFAAIGSLIGSRHSNTITRIAVPQARKVGLIANCGSQDVRLSLSAKSQTIPMGGSLQLKARIDYVGTSSCLIDASPAKLVLQISNSQTSQSQTSQQRQDEQSNKVEQSNKTNNNTTKSEPPVWSSDVCPVANKPLLMAKGDHYEQTFTWNARSTRSLGCVEENSMPIVDRGTYVAQLVHTQILGLRSEPVSILVQ